MRRWVGLALHELDKNLPEEWHWMLTEVRQIITELATEGDEPDCLIPQIATQSDGASRCRILCFGQVTVCDYRLAENWARFRVFDWHTDVPWTNNPTEQVIGRN